MPLGPETPHQVMADGNVLKGWTRTYPNWDTCKREPDPRTLPFKKIKWPCLSPQCCCGAIAFHRLLSWHRCLRPVARPIVADSSQHRGSFAGDVHSHLTTEVRPQGKAGLLSCSKTVPFVSETRPFLATQLSENGTYDACTPTASTWNQYLTALYWAATTVTTVGYGDIRSVTAYSCNPHGESRLQL